MRRFGPLAVGVGLALAGAVALRGQAPLVVGERPAVSKEDGPCWDDTNRYVDCGNGTVTDTVTQLVWLQIANCTEFPGMGGASLADWPTAMEAVAALEDGLCGLTDGSEPGDWRLPTQAEWEATLARARDGLGCTGGSAPTWTNDPGTACVSTPPTSFVGISPSAYWSSSIDALFTAFADLGSLTNGSSTNHAAKFANAGVWPVRGRCYEFTCTD